MESQLTAMGHMLLTNPPVTQLKKDWAQDLDEIRTKVIRPNADSAKEFYDALREAGPDRSLQKTKDIYHKALHAKRTNNTANSVAISKIQSVNDVIIRNAEV